jgi:hypothetical protein
MRRTVHLVQTIATLALALGTSGAPAAAAAQPSATAAYDQVASCFNERRHLAVLALVDESTSLRGTDPAARRVDALVGMLRTLARYGRTTEGGQAGTVEVQLAGFGTRFDRGEWTALNDSTEAGLESRAREFAGRDGQNDTDFTAALLGAQEEFVTKDAAVTAAGERQPCRLLLLFTDGVYDLGTPGQRPYAPGVAGSDLAAIIDRGRHALCDPGQLADQLRDTGSVILAIGLVPEKPGRGGPPDQTFLQSVAERSAGGRTCGESTGSPGKYVAASGLTQLLAAFDAAIVGALGGTATPGDPQVPVCADAGSADSRCERAFTLDASLREFHMLLNLGAPGVEAELRAPTGERLRLHAGQQGTAGIAGTSLMISRLADLDLVVDGRLPSTGTDWVGTWTVRFIDTTGQNLGAVARSQITVFGGLVPVTEPGPPQFQVGERTDFDIRIVDAAGSPRTPADFVRSANVTAVLVDPQGKETPVPVDPVRPDGGYAAHYRFPDDASVSYVDLKVTLAVVTSSGLPLLPRSTIYRVPVKQPSAYPTIGPPELVLSPIIKQGRATGTITVTGGLGGRGCVWFGQAEFTRAPANSGRFDTRFDPPATGEANCVRVDPRQQVRIQIAVRPDQVRTGLADGQLVATLTADNEPPRQVRIPVRFQLQHPVDTRFQATLFGLVLAGGVALPLLLLWLMSWATARFVAPGLLRRAELRVVVTAGGVLTEERSRRIGSVVGPQAFGAMPPDVPPGRARRFSCGVLRFRRRIPWLPWTLPKAEVRSGGQLLSSTGLGRRDLSAAGVDFELNNTWVFAIEENLGDADRVRVRGTLFLFVSDFDLAEKVPRLLGDVEHQLPARVEAAADRLTDTEAPLPPAVQQPPENPVYVPPPSK